MTSQREEATPPTIDDPAFLTALVTEHFVLQTARSIGTGEATGHAGLYVATLSSGLVATGFASGKPYFAVFLGAVLIVVLALGLVTFARLVEISREDLARLRDIRIVHRYYGALSPGARGYFKDVDTQDISAVIETQDLELGCPRHRADRAGQLAGGRFPGLGRGGRPGRSGGVLLGFASFRVQGAEHARPITLRVFVG
jgi:hypothetical protein